MKIAIHHTSTYAYAEPVSFSPHIFRLIPKTGRHVAVQRFSFHANQGAVVNWRRDLFDNEVASCFFPEPARTLATELHMQLELEETNAFGFLLDAHALHLPFGYQPVELRVLAPYLQTAAAPSLPFWQTPVSPEPTVRALVALNSAIHDNLAYERREEGAARPSVETLALGRGACRDFAVLLVDVLRGLGLAARHASGYLCEFGEGEKRAEAALHAWVEVYLPGAGWLGLDPTNGTLCDHHHITAAVGLDVADIAPIVGSYYANHHVPQQMSTSLEIAPA